MVLNLTGGGKRTIAIVKGKDGLLIKSGKVHKLIVRIKTRVGTIRIRKGVLHTRTNTLLSRITTGTTTTNLNNVRFTTKVPKDVNNTIAVGTNTCNKRVGSIVQRIAILAPRYRRGMLSQRRLSLSCERDYVPGGRFLMLRTRLSLAPTPRRRVHTGVTRLERGHIRGRPLRCPDTNDAFGHPRNCFTKGLVVSTKLENCTIKSTRISRGRYKFIVGEKGTATTRVLRLVGSMRRHIGGRSNIALRPRIGVVKRF